MPGSLRRSILKIVVAIVIAVAILYAARYLLAFFSGTYPELSKYLVYIEDAVAGVIAIGIAAATVSILGQFIGSLSEKTNGKSNFRGVFIFVRIVIYAAVIFWFLSYIGVNLEGALVGGAIGGVAIGFAVQSVVSNLLSGLMVSGGGFIRPGDAISVYSWLFGQTITGRVEDVRALYTRIRNAMGQTFLIPNTALLGTSIYTSLGAGKDLSYTFNVVLPADIPADKLLDRAREELKNFAETEPGFTADIYLSSKAGATNTFSVVMKFPDMEKLALFQDSVNRAFDSAYWSIKKPPGST